MTSHSSLAIANEFIKRANSCGKNDITQMKLQKLVYLSHGWALAALDAALIGDEIEAWEFGPVIPKLYHAIKRHGRSPIRTLINWGDDTDFPFDDDGEAYEDLTADEQGVIDLVWDSYGDFPAFQLSALTHQDGTPWSQSYVPRGRNIRIPDASIKAHFLELMNPA